MTPPGHHWVKTLVPASLHHRLRAYAGLSEMALPAFILATLANAVPLARTEVPRGPSPRSGGETGPGPGLGPTVPAPAAPVSAIANGPDPAPAPALQAPNEGDPRA